MTHWTDDKRWSDQFLPEIKGILGQHLIVEAPLEEDRDHNTDLMVLRADSMRIACRIRRVDDNYEKYRKEFTIRSSRPKGTKTELRKIIEGWGDYIFYGFGVDGRLHRWGIGNLYVFRGWLADQLYLGRMPGKEMMNTDGSSKFRVFRWDELPPGFCLANGEMDGTI